MRAVCWNGKRDVRVESVDDPRLLNPRDAIIETELTAICGSDLHLYNGNIPTMQAGDILGHEFIGRVVEVGPEVDGLALGDRVAVPFPIACGRCFYCGRGAYSFCDNSNPNAWMAEKVYGYSPAGLFGYSHMLGGYAGGQAEYVRVPYADVGPVKLPPELSAEQLLFLTDVFPTGFQAAENCRIQPGDVIAVWGCGPVGQFAARSAILLGAERVIAIDAVPERLAMASLQAGVEALNENDVGDVTEALRDLTGGRGPDACIDAVGMEAHGPGLQFLYDRAKQAMMLETDRPIALREAITACRSGGTVSVAGAYGGFLDKIPFGSLMNRSLTVRTGQTHVQRYMKPLLERVQKGEIDPSFIVTHRLSLDEAPDAYEMFLEKQDECMKVVLSP